MSKKGNEKKPLKCKIVVLDPVHSVCNKRTREVMESALSYDTIYFKQHQFGKKRIVNTKCMIDGRNFRFYTGLVPKIKKYCKRKKIPLSIKYNYDDDLFNLHQIKPKVKGIKFRDDQKKLLKRSLKAQRGVVLSATGTGKTILTMGVLSAYPEARVVFLCHTADIVRQSAKEFLKFGIKDVGQYGAGIKEAIGDERIICCTIQTFVKYMEDRKFMATFDAVLIDETHHVTKPNSQYGKVLQTLICPLRYGFTATLPTKKEGELYLEALIGPVLGSFDIVAAQEAGVLSKTKISLRGVKWDPQIGQFTKYAELYNAGITNNRGRNEDIVKVARKRVKKKKNVLIMVKEIAHGENIEALAQLIGLDVFFVKGHTQAKVRDAVKEKLNSGKLRCVICTSVWREGINIPELDVVMLACGGKDAIPVLQAIGRGTRKTDRKSTMEFIDWLDPYKYLDHHTIMRLQIYVKNKWL